jgi:hypothetical protein
VVSGPSKRATTMPTAEACAGDDRVSPCRDEASPRVTRPRRQGPAINPREPRVRVRTPCVRGRWRRSRRKDAPLVQRTPERGRTRRAGSVVVRAR